MVPRSFEEGVKFYHQQFGNQHAIPLIIPVTSLANLSVEMQYGNCLRKLIENGIIAKEFAPSIYVPPGTASYLHHERVEEIPQIQNDGIYVIIDAFINSGRTLGYANLRLGQYGVPKDRRWFIAKDDFKWNLNEYPFDLAGKFLDAR
jgi:hypothetical protein